MSSTVDTTDFASYYIGNLVIAGLWITPLTIIWFISLCLARRRKDPARVGVAWMKAAYAIWIVALVLAVTTSALQLFLWYDNEGFISTDLFALGQALNTIASTGQLFENVGDILLFITFVELGSGFLLCLNGGGPTPVRKYTRIIALAWTLLLFILALSLYGFTISIDARYWASVNDGPSYDDTGAVESSGNPYAQSTQYTDDVNAGNRLTAAVLFLLWITSIPVLVYASFVMHKTMKHPMLRSSATLLLVAVILHFSRLLANATIFAVAYLPTNPVTATTVSPAVIFYVAPIFDYLFQFVALVLIFALAVRKLQGLWLRQGGWDNSYIAPYPGGGTVAYMPDGRPVQIFQVPPPAGVGPVQHPGMQPGGGGMQTPELPAYLQVAQQRAWEQQQQQQMQQQQGYGGGPGYAPQQGYQHGQQQVPAELYHQQHQQQMAEPKSVAGVVQAQDVHVVLSQAELGDENPREMHELEHGGQEYRQ